MSLCIEFDALQELHELSDLVDEVLDGKGQLVSILVFRQPTLLFDDVGADVGWELGENDAPPNVEVQELFSVALQSDDLLTQDLQSISNTLCGFRCAGHLLNVGEHNSRHVGSQVVAVSEQLDGLGVVAVSDRYLLDETEGIVLQSLAKVEELVGVRCTVRGVCCCRDDDVAGAGA